MILYQSNSTKCCLLSVSARRDRTGEGGHLSLKWQVAGLVVCRRVKHLRVSGRSGLSSCSLRSGRCCCGCCRLGCSSGGLSRSLIALLHAPSADAGVPATVELARLNVERNGYQVVDVARVVLDTVLAEDFEAYLAWILLLRLQYIRLYFPWVTRFADAFLQRQYLYDFSYNFHLCNLY